MSRRWLVGLVVLSLSVGCASPRQSLDRAKSAATAGDLDKAIAIAEGIRSDTAAGKEAGALLPAWRETLARKAAGADPVTAAMVAPMDQAKNDDVRANARILQMILASYVGDSGGALPPDMASLKSSAEQGGYWKQATNPFDPAQPAFVDFARPTPGAVGYEVAGQSSKYVLHAWSNDGKPIQQAGRDFTITN